MYRTSTHSPLASPLTLTRLHLVAGALLVELFPLSPWPLGQVTEKDRHTLCRRWSVARPTGPQPGQVVGCYGHIPHPLDRIFTCFDMDRYGRPPSLWYGVEAVDYLWRVYPRQLSLTTGRAPLDAPSAPRISLSVVGWTTSLGDTPLMWQAVCSAELVEFWAENAL